MNQSDSIHKTKVEEEAIASFLRARYADPITDLTFITGGESSQAFSFSVGGDEYILRVNNHNMAGYAKERYAFLHYASQLIPIPETIDIGKMDSGHYFSISKKARGEQIKNLSDDEIERTLPSLFRTLEVIHSVDISDKTGFGMWNDAGVAKNASWKDVMLEVDEFAVNMFENSFLEKDVWDIVYARFIELLSFCPEERHLVHGDCNFDNVFAKDEAVTALIDWETSMYGDPMYDIAWLSFWAIDFDYEKAYLDFRGNSAKEIPFFKERVLCYKLYIGLRNLSFFAYSKQKEKYERSKEKLFQFLKESSD